MNELCFNSFLKVVFLILTVNLMIKFSKWLLKYFSKLKSVNKIKGLPMIPFIGNVHQLKKKNGDFFFLNLRFVQLINLF